MRILNHIDSHEDLLAVSRQDEPVLCDEIRQWLVENVSKTGGHLASNLGIVELQVAIEKEFDTRVDRLVYDVGHQSYVHKILTGRRDAMASLRTLGGISGFPKPVESETDAFVAGHASNAVSVALGMARARTLQKADYTVIALLGDGAQMLHGTVDVSEMMGSAVHLHVTSQGKDVIIIVQTMDLQGPHQVSLTSGQDVAFTFGGNVVHLFDRETGKNLEA